MKRFFIVFIALLLLVGAASAATYTVNIYPLDPQNLVLQNDTAGWTVERGSPLADIRNASAGTAYVGIKSGASDSVRLNRMLIVLNLTTVPANATINSVTLKLYPNPATPSYTTLGNREFGLTGMVPEYYTSLGKYDFNNFEDTVLSNYVHAANWTAGAYRTLNLTPTGLAYINKGSYTGFMVRIRNDIENDVSGISWSTDNVAAITTYFTTYTGTSQDPYWEVNFTEAGSPPVAGFTQNVYRGFQTLNVQFTDTSTNSPTSWYWEFGDTGTSTSQNPSHNYASCGVYNVNLKATNAGGSDWENKTGTVRIACNDAPGPMPKLYNNATNLSISTYDGSGQLTHPSVVYTAAGWNGYHYLMAMTPYPGGDDSYENPSMRYSNDMINWEPMAGAPDPIIPEPAAGHYADTNLFLNGTTLYLFYRYNDGSYYYNYTTSTDGVTWTTPVKTNIATHSNSFVWNDTGWESWGHDPTTPYPISHFTTSDLTTWTSTGTITISVPTTPWHSEVKYYDSQYQMLLTPENYQYLNYYNSTDGITWTNDENNPVLNNATSGWDSRLYKSTWHEHSNVFDVWYTGWTYPSITWHVGLAEKSPPDPPVAAFSANNLTVCEGTNTQFTDASTNTPTSWLWDFGDGNTSTTQNPLKTYDVLGLKTVKLTVSNAYGSDDEEKADYINVTSCPSAPAGNCTLPADHDQIVVTNSYVVVYMWQRIA